jgi:hypothetical protein
MYFNSSNRQPSHSFIKLQGDLCKCMCKFSLIFMICPFVASSGFMSLFHGSITVFVGKYMVSEFWDPLFESDTSCMFIISYLHLSPSLTYISDNLNMLTCEYPFKATYSWQWQLWQAYAMWRHTFPPIWYQTTRSYIPEDHHLAVREAL